MPARNFLKRAYQNNYLGVQKVGSFFAKGGASIQAFGGWSTSITTNGTSRVWSFSVPSNSSPTAGIALTFSVGTAATDGFSINGSYTPKYFSDPNKDTGGTRSVRKENFHEFEILSVGAGNDGSPGYYDSNAWQSPQAGPGGAGGGTVGQTYNGINTSYTISFGTSPEPVNILYFRQPPSAIGVAKTGGLKGAGGAGGVGGWSPRSTDENFLPGSTSAPGSGGITSSITGTSLGYGGGGGGGGGGPSPGGASGVNGGGNGGAAGPFDSPTWPPGTPGTRGGGGGGGAIYRYGGGAGGPYTIVIKSAPDSV